MYEKCQYYTDGYAIVALYMHAATWSVESCRYA